MAFLYLWRSLTTLTVAQAICVLVAPAAAKCFDPAGHLRGGQWKEWILQITPGPASQKAVEQIIDEINAPRLANKLPPFVFSKDSPIVFGAIDESNPRGPNGEPLKNQQQVSVIRNTSSSTVVVDLKVQLADPILHAIFNDPANRYLQLIEADRVVRLQRQP